MLSFNSLFQKKILFLFPHPDDESYSCSVLIKRLQKENSAFYLLYLSTGVSVREEFVSPMADKYSYDEYIETRKSEWIQAMNLLNLRKEQFRCLGYPTRTTMYHLHEIINYVIEFIRSNRISIVFTSPYEGAHPDHDICSYIGSIITRKILSASCYEYAGYFLHKGRLKSGTFLTNFKKNLLRVLVSSQEKEFKRKLLSIYRSQSIILDNFELTNEFFRSQPDYDYSSIPSNEIYYLQWQSSLGPKDVINAIKKYNQDNLS